MNFDPKKQILKIWSFFDLETLLNDFSLFLPLFLIRFSRVATLDFCETWQPFS